MARGGSRGGGGGGRSSGFGGGRSSGVRMGGGARGGSRGGSLGGGSRGGSMGGWGQQPHVHRPAPRPGVHLHVGPSFGFGGWGRRRRRGRGMGPAGPGGCGSGCAPLVIALLVVFLVIFVIMFANSGSRSSSGGGGFNVGLGGAGNISSSGGVTRSTVKREALPRGSVTETAYYTDELDWIGNRTVLTNGMRNFYQRTGVQPYLYITDTVYGTHSPTGEQIRDFAEEKYEELFTDEAHLLIVFFEHIPSEYITGYTVGRMAKQVLDDEAIDILLDYIDLYYYQDDRYNEEEFFSKAFDEASKRIMEVTASPWIPVLVVAGILLTAFLGYNWWKKAQAQKNLEAEQTEKILSQSLDTFGADDEASQRAKKYEEDNK